MGFCMRTIIVLLKYVWKANCQNTVSYVSRRFTTETSLVLQTFIHNLQSTRFNSRNAVNWKPLPIVLILPLIYLFLCICHFAVRIDKILIRLCSISRGVWSQWSDIDLIPLIDEGRSIWRSIFCSEMYVIDHDQFMPIIFTLMFHKCDPNFEPNIDWRKSRYKWVY